MAFTATTFQFNRGVTTSATNGSGIGTVIHGYKSTDTHATIATANYFPDSIDGSDDKIFVGDLLLIVASDTVAMSKVTALAPFAIGADLFGGAGSPIIMNIPVAATDANGIKISGTTVQLEIADATHPGIVTELDQNFAGIKMFNSGAKFLTFGGTPTLLNYYEELDHVSTFTLNAETSSAATFKLVRIGNAITIRNTTAITTPGQGAPTAFYNANTVLPARFRPSVACSGYWRVSNGGVFKTGAIQIGADGSIHIYNSDDFTTAYTTAQINGFFTCAFAYTI